MNLEEELISGEAIDGPGDAGLTWVVERVEQGLSHPPRPVMRLYPKENQTQIRALILAIEAEAE